MSTFHHDVLIIGSGAAGLTVALQLPGTLEICVLSKAGLQQANTYYAQGGVAAVMDEGDSLDAHIADTLAAGAGLCHKDAVDFTVRNGPKTIKWLIDNGVAFSTETAADGSYDLHLTKEGGHSHRRVIHAADSTGIAISNSLTHQVKLLENVSLCENQIAIDLITQCSKGSKDKHCVGAYILNNNTGKIDVHLAKAVVLACGGASKVYQYTSNPDVATGDGIAMAWRAGCRVSNMEFNQFHPTCLYHPKAKSFLITEALRGEGAKLLLPDGTQFMQRFDKREELAPRDIVARAIDYEMKRLGSDCLYLDISHRNADFIIHHFPTVYAKCLSLGLDITKEPIPVVPAAHYTCGGVLTDQHGRTDINQLYSIGETAFTGLHGANRMASNSLLECFVYGRSASSHIEDNINNNFCPENIIPWDESQVTDSDEDIVIAHNWNELRHFMWDYVGIVRTDKRLQRAKHRVELLQREIREYYSNHKISGDLLELRNLVQIGQLIIESAIQRTESRGLHYNLDHPEQLELAEDTILTPKKYRKGTIAKKPTIPKEQETV